ncbi:hypothetical protein [Caballeronia sp. LjRoot31]|uniref:hypothetical protein n=1 Tax=Caballeronia sp. LjRoot31 TaxID=3342324 RepID=UPI003ECC8819
MEPLTSSYPALPQPEKQSFFKRIKRPNGIFILSVVIPTALSIGYYALVASDVYVSESRFVVRSPQRQAQTSVVGALLQGTGFSRAQDDTYPVIDYIQSRDALTELNTSNHIYNSYSQRGDIFSRFVPGIDPSFEALWKYYQKKIVSVELDSTSAITTLQVRAFTSADAAQINEQLLELSEHLVNRMNQRAAYDSVRFAQTEVNEAASKAKDAAAALASFRNANTVFDPERQSALQLQQVTALQAQLYSSQAQLTGLQSISPLNPQVPVLKTNISSLEQQIKDANGGVTGNTRSLSAKAGAYARLQLDSQFADKQLASAMTTLDGARAEAQRKQLYLERLIQPNRPDVAIEPKRLRGIATTFVLGLIAWASLSLLIASVREHRD